MVVSQAKHYDTTLQCNYCPNTGIVRHVGGCSLLCTVQDSRECHVLLANKVQPWLGHGSSLHRAGRAVATQQSASQGTQCADLSSH